MERKKGGKEEKRKKIKERTEKVVKKFRLRHTLIFCYGEENSAKKFRGGKRNQT